MTKTAHLPDRAVLAVTGVDRVAFLQGLVSNDVSQAIPGRAVWAALLTPQGKWLADFFIFADADRLLLDCETGQTSEISRRLQRFRLRAQVAIGPDPMAVHVAWDGAPPPAPIRAPDPRLAAAGWRLLTSETAPSSASAADYDRHRIALGLPDGSRDMEAEKSTLLEAGFDELSGVSWTKGCYMGQELTARTKYRGLVKRRLIPVTGDAPLPAAGAAVTRNGQEVGWMRSSSEGLGLALLRTDAVDDDLVCAGVTLRARRPGWLVTGG